MIKKNAEIYLNYFKKLLFQIIIKLEKHSESADLRQAAPFPHTMIPTKRTVLYLFHFYEPSLKSL